MLNISEIIGTIKNLIEIRLNIIKEDIQNEVITFITRVAILTLMILSSVFILLFASFSLAFYLSELTYSTYLGFLYVSLIYLILFMILYWARNATFLQSHIQKSLGRFVFLFKKKIKENE